MNSKQWLLAMCVGVGVGAAGAVQAAPNVNVSIDGRMAPGVYGRIEIGNAPPPVLVYPQPVVIYQPVRPVQAAPIYLNVPPGHAKNWSKHCRHYNACGQPVYFVRTAEYEPGYRDYREQKHDGKDKEKDKGRGRDKHGHGHDRDD